MGRDAVAAGQPAADAARGREAATIGRRDERGDGRSARIPASSHEPRTGARRRSAARSARDLAARVSWPRSGDRPARRALTGRRARPCPLPILEDVDVEPPKDAPLLRRADGDRHRRRPAHRCRRRRAAERRRSARATASDRRRASTRRPPSPSRAQAIRDLYTIVFLIAVAIFFVVEGLILWSVLRYHRKPGDDTLPAQTHGNNIAEAVWTIVPTHHRGVPVRHLLADAERRRRRVGHARDADRGPRRPVPVELRLPRRRRRDGPLHPAPPDRRGRRHVRADRPHDPAVAGEPATSSTPSTSRSSCSSATSCRVGSTSSTSRWTRTRPDRRQTFRGQCAELCGSGHSIMLFDVHAMTAADFDAWLADKVARPNATPAPPPSVAPGASGSPPPSGAPAAGPAAAGQCP